MPSVLNSQKTALITGAASGVGFAIAKLCREKGMHLHLVDVDAENLEKAKTVLNNLDSGLKTSTYVLDVSDQSAWERFAEVNFNGLDLVVLNAGKGYKAQGQAESRQKTWEDVNYWKKTLDTNVFGVLNGINALLPVMKSSPPSPKAIVITGSKQGITNPPGGANPAYNASKAAINSLTEHLAHDLRSDKSTAHISAHLLVPGWTWTGLMGNIGPTDEASLQKPAGAWLPSQVAAELESGLEKGSFYIICPDGETDRALDQARMKWGSEDVVEGRPPLSRWDEGWKGEADKWIQEEAARRR